VPIGSLQALRLQPRVPVESANVAAHVDGTALLICIRRISAPGRSLLSSRVLSPRAILDTGSSRFMLCRSFAEKAGVEIRPLNPPLILGTITGEPVKCHASADVDVCVPCCTGDFYIPTIVHLVEDELFPYADAYVPLPFAESIGHVVFPCKSRSRACPTGQA
jgi:hypothetical protein